MLARSSDLAFLFSPAFVGQDLGRVLGENGLIYRVVITLKV
jgi:hypothetical protein